ncbi:RcnB family protein [Terricaulis silvestris]|uniref:Putative integral membrane protein n=1 Tax=Terricaulis silvestris TaxID=2686094 RepID=A0A6I6MVU5_9CAUL|nr:RcnB family protein [Terricaulis silvestris]QGZ95273.1 putative integral membrane protein [Terricaulis silvestris]
MNKIFKTAALAALVAVGPLAMTGTAAAQSRRDVREERQDVRDARQNLREQRRDVRQAQRWNQRNHNGYYVGNRFYYGQPNGAQMQRRDYRPAYQQWRRGDRLPNYARSSYRQVDYRREHLRAPPRGYHYVRDDRGEVLLVGIATGVILSILLNQ